MYTIQKRRILAALLAFVLPTAAGHCPYCTRWKNLRMLYDSPHRANGIYRQNPTHLGQHPRVVFLTGRMAARAGF